MEIQILCCQNAFVFNENKHDRLPFASDSRRHSWILPPLSMTYIVIIVIDITCYSHQHYDNSLVGMILLIPFIITFS